MVCSRDAPQHRGPDVSTAAWLSRCFCRRKVNRAPLCSEPSEGGRCCRLEMDQRPGSGSRLAPRVGASDRPSRDLARSGQHEIHHSILAELEIVGGFADASRSLTDRAISEQLHQAKLALNLTAGHQELVEVQERYLETNSQKSRARKCRQVGAGTHQGDIARLQEIKKKIAGKLLLARTRQREPSKPLAP
jgi:hypothetical protein